MISINQLYFEYPKSDFKFYIPELAIESGSRTAIIGPSGYGKTTLLNLLSGISTPLKGNINVDGVDLTTLNGSARRNFRISNIGFVFQNFELVEYLNLFDNILLSYRINPSLKLTKEIQYRAVDLASKMGLEDKLKRNVNKLSQGEMQRVAICRALLAGPKLLLADEPTGNLDPDNKDLTIRILFKYSEENNATLITVTHDHSILDGFDKIIDLQTFHN